MTHAFFLPLYWLCIQENFDKVSKNQKPENFTPTHRMYSVSALLIIIIIIIITRKFNSASSLQLSESEALEYY